ncbi:phage BR0599 family protein [Rhodovulum sp. DZ06]|uniref:phage BR0599 family protein n=1 Tax=Rhodovulum sp. DZ06 TaxID=3425126 RepID=UPI003D351735
MSILSRLLSRAGAAPVFLYTFTWGKETRRFAGNAGGYTVPAGLLDAEAVFFEGRAIGHSGFQSGTAADTKALRVTFPLEDDWAGQWLRPLGTVEIGLMIHVADQAAPGDGVALEWKGRIVGPQLEGEKLALVGQARITRAREGGGVKTWSPLCTHAVYGRGCGLAMADHLTLASCTALDGRNLTVPEAAADPARWRGGVLIHEGEMRFIRAAAADGGIQIAAPLPGLEAAFAASAPVEVSLAPGCDLSAATCRDRFGNLANRLGFDHAPGLDPFSMRSIAS